MLKLHLGSGDDLRPGYLNVDVHEPPGATPENFLRWDLSGRWSTQEIRDSLFATGCPPELPQYFPWDDSTAEDIILHDCAEHLDNPWFPGQKGIIWCLNEAHRVLKPGGILDLWVPCLPGIAPWVDPTHVSVWTSDLRYYFDERWNNPQGERGRLGPSYGITALFRTRPESRSGVDWTPIQYAVDAPDRRKLMLILEAVK